MNLYDDENLETITKLALNSSQPFYVYSLAQIADRCLTLIEAFPKDIEIFYSLKANSHPKIVAAIKKSGLGADVASAGELKVALEAGFTGDEIGFNGPGKTMNELRAAVSANVGSIVIESIQELELLNEVAGEFRRKLSAHVRVNPKSKVNATGRVIHDEPSQFGVDEEAGEPFAREAEACTNVAVVGMHFHTQSQILSIDHAIENQRLALAAAENFSRTLPSCRSIVNLGGGIGIPYSPDQAAVDLRKLGHEVTGLLLKAKAQHAFANTKFRFEFGRLVTGEAGAFVTRVLYTKKSRGLNFAITDGGFTQSQIAVGAGQLIRRNLPIRVLSGKNEVSTKDIRARLSETVSIAGPSCYGIDVLASNVDLPKIEVGDLICIENVGAYGYSFSPNQFLRQQQANEYFI